MEAVLALLIAFGMCVLVPIGLLAAIVLVLMRRSQDRHSERMAMIDRGVAPGAVPAASPEPGRAVGWAAGVVVGGVLWMFADTLDLSRFGIILTAVGVAYLTRGILGLAHGRRPARGEFGGGGNS